MEKTIIEGNKLIAEFMCNSNKFLQYETNAHSSWDLLMSVVEKIESLDFYFWIMYSKYDNVGKINQVNINGFDFNYPCSKSECSILTRHVSKLEATYQAVIQFIQWYNSQSK